MADDEPSNSDKTWYTQTFPVYYDTFSLYQTLKLRPLGIYPDCMQGTTGRCGCCRGIRLWDHGSNHDC